MVLKENYRITNYFKSIFKWFNKFLKYITKAKNYIKGENKFALYKWKVKTIFNSTDFFMEIVWQHINAITSWAEITFLQAVNICTLRMIKKIKMLTYPVSQRVTSVQSCWDINMSQFYDDFLKTLATVLLLACPRL